MMDLSELHITRVPYTGRHVRTKGHSKYQELFDRMTEGDCVEFPSCQTTTRRVQLAMKRWIDKQGKSDKLKAVCVTYCKDGKSRVWLLGKGGDSSVFANMVQSHTSRKVRSLGDW